MQQFLYQNRKKIVVGVVIAAIIGAVLFVYFYYLIFRVTSVSPDLNSSISPSTQIMTVTFNRTLKGKSVTLSASNGLQTSNSINGKTLTINLPVGLNLNSSYVITLASVTASDGSTLKNVRLSFKTNNDPSVTGDQLKSALQRQEDNLPTAYNDPVYKALPYTGNQYVIQAHLNAPLNSSENSSVGIEIIIYLTDDQEGDNRLSAIQSIEDAALAHLQAIPNVNLDNYEIDYTIQDPVT